MANGYAKYSGFGGGGGTGTVTNVSVATANGFSGTVATPTTTPVITIQTTVTGLLVGNGTAVSAYTGGNLTDVGTDGITITNGTGAVIGTGTQIAQAAATASQNGYLKSVDWTTFNNKQAAGNYITALTGDGTASGPGSVALTLATVNTNTGSFGSSTSIPSFTVNGKGLITAASGNVVIAPAGTLSGTTLNSTVVSSSLTSLGTITTGVWNGTTIAVANGGTGVTSVTTAPAATAFAGWDANKNFSANTFLSAFTSIVSSATPVTLTVASNQTQYFTGTTAQSVVLPVASTLANNTQFQIVNATTQTLTVTTSGANTIQAMAAGTQLFVTCINNAGGTGTASWLWEYLGTNGTALPAAAGTLTGTTLKATVVTSSLTTVGTIATGTWNATAIGTANGGTGQTSVIVAPTASTYAGWDANKNFSANNLIDGFTTTATAAGTTALTVASTGTQFFTGATTQTVTLPTTSIVAGGQYYIENRSTGLVTVQSSGANTITTLSQNTGAIFTALVATPTTAANWDFLFTPNIVGSSSGQVWTSTGATSAPTWQAAAVSVTNNYASGSTAAAGSWAVTSATYADPANTGGNAYTSNVASGITVTAAATNLPGITFTPAASTSVYFITASTAVTTSNSLGGCGFKLVDGSGVVIGYDQSQNGSSITSVVRSVHLHGVYVPATGSAVTVKIQAAAYNGGTETMGDFSTVNPSIFWTVFQMK